jgi:hypothetical protein
MGAADLAREQRAQEPASTATRPTSQTDWSRIWIAL